MADDNTPPPMGRQMSLIPYAHDSREIVLRRGNAVVVYDADSRQLSVRHAAETPVELTDCPYCHRPLRSRDSSGEDDDRTRAFGPERPVVNPEYFGMLAASQRPSPVASGHSTPSRRVHPAIRSGRSRQVSANTDPPPTDAEFVASEPSSASGQGISASAFSPGYFQQFFREERELGRGGNGVVLLVEHVIDNVSLGHFACKRIPVGDSRAYFEKVIVEVRLLQKIPHKNLVAYHWTWLEDHQPSKFGPTIPCLWILQDYCNGGDLHSYVVGPQEISTTDKVKHRFRRMSKGDKKPSHELHGRSKLAFEEIFSFFRDITSGLHHLHSKGYIHRDLKPSNCLIQRDGGRTRLLISDFGEVQAAGATRGSSGATGTISYCAPEVLQRTPEGTLGNFTTKSDIFSLGMVVYFMCFGRLPYTNANDFNEENEDLDELKAEITRWPGFNEDARLRSDLPERLYKFLKKLLSVDPNERPSTDDILASIKGGATLGDMDWSPEDYSSRVSAIDSPAPHSSTRTRRQSYIARTGLQSSGRQSPSDSTRAKSPTKHDHTRPLGSSDSSLAIGPRRKIEAPPLAADSQSRPIQPLMLPPPPEKQVITRVYQFIHEPRSSMTLRAVFFFIKLISLSVPCTPYSANLWLMYPLLGMASLDLGLLPFGIRQSLILLGTHLVFVLIAYQHGRLCEAGSLISWEHI